MTLWPKNLPGGFEGRFTTASFSQDIDGFDENVIRKDLPSGRHASLVGATRHPGRSSQIATKQEREVRVDPDTWRATAEAKNGPWWPDGRPDRP